MGNFVVKIVAVGGHGCDRAAKRGEHLVHAHTGNLARQLFNLLGQADPDCFFAALSEAMKVRGMLDENAAMALGEPCAVTLTHWPQAERIVDGISEGIRYKSFDGLDDARRAYAAYWAALGEPAPADFEDLTPTQKQAWSRAASGY